MTFDDELHITMLDDCLDCKQIHKLLYFLTDEAASLLYSPPSS